MTSNVQAPDSDLFGPTIYTYTRLQAVKDGFQVPVLESTTKQAGILFPVYLTRAVFDKYVEVPAKVEGQDLEGRLWDIVSMTAYAIRRSGRCSDRVTVRVYVRNDNRRHRLVELLAVVSALDIDDARPAITIQLPDES